jgi:hypothetical protein
VLKLDDYLHQKTGTLHVSESAFELGDYTALGKFEDLDTARRAIGGVEGTSSDAQLTLAQSALSSMSSAVSEDAAGFVARRTLNGADRDNAQRFADLRIASGAADVEVLDRSSEVGSA